MCSLVVNILIILLIFVKNNDKREILKEIGGGNIYIPSYKTLMRGEGLKQDFKAPIKQGLTTKMEV